MYTNPVFVKFLSRKVCFYGVFWVVSEYIETAGSPASMDNSEKFLEQLQTFSAKGLMNELHLDL